MCGIAGYVGDGSIALLKRMGNRIAHRGPNDDGFWQDERVGLGHRRLSIIDLAGGHQPMSNEDNTVWIVFNGEIYNYDELRDDLEEKGHRFDTNSDTEVIVHGYEEFGDPCVEHLRGMFAFALWDSIHKRLFCARDRLGIKPFYYCETDSLFAFGSEIKALFEVDGIEPKLCPSALHKYLTFRYVPGPKTAFEGVRALQPGCTLVYESGRISLSQYWSIDDVEPASYGPEEAIEVVEQTLSRAVEMRLMAEVPLAVYLSGGLDSSLLAALMRKHSAVPPQALSVSFCDQGYDESSHAATVAEHLGLEHHTLQAGTDSLAVLPRVAYHLDQPLADAATIPMYQMAQLTPEYATVVLSGAGADECFAGYPQSKLAYYLLGPGRYLPSKLFRWLTNVLTGHGQARRACAALAAGGNPVRYILDLTSHFDSRGRTRIAGPALADRLDDYEQDLTEFVHNRCQNGSPFERFLKFQLNTWLPDDLLLKNDRMTMAHGIEARVPYLDHEFVELAFSLPESLKIRGLQEKVALRRIADEYLPVSICKRAKKGFTVPLEDWMPKTQELALQGLERLAVQGFLNYPACQRIIRGAEEGRFAQRKRRVLWFLGRWYVHAFEEYGL